MLGDGEGAADLYHGILEADPSNDKARAELVQMYKEQGRYDQALALARAGRTAEPDSADAADLEAEVLFDRGAHYVNDGLWTQAVEDFQSALKLNPYQPYAHHSLATTYERLGLREAAIKAYLQELRFNPAYMPAHFQLGRLYLALGMDEEALAALRAALELAPLDPDVHYHVGLAWKAAGNLPRAIASLSRAVQLRPDAEPAFRELAELQLAAGDYESAEAAYRAIIALHEDFRFDAEFGYGRALALGKKYTAAIDQFRRILVARPTHALARLELARATLALGGHSKALEQYRQVLETAPDLVDARAEAAECLLVL
ncbi:MAG: tetratricopeptide repeat protein, partial [Candidatus Methylomirabilis sp.]|nr:tetratricopeptide repeat protein [Deltaproteobacteria bacterium]